MSKVLVTTLVISRAAPLASLALAQAISSPPQTGSMAPPDMIGPFHTNMPMLSGQPNTFWPAHSAVQQGPASSAAGAPGAEAAQRRLVGGGWVAAPSQGARAQQGQAGAGAAQPVIRPHGFRGIER